MKIVINGQEITEDTFKGEMNQIRAQMPGATEAQQQDNAIRRIVERTLLRQEANRSVSNVSSKEVQQELDRLASRHGGREQFLRRYNLTDKDESDSVCVTSSSRSGQRVGRGASVETRPCSFNGSQF